MKFSEEIIQKVWDKSKTVSGYDSTKWGKDECGAWIGRQNYGDRDSKYGWEIDHIKPESERGTEELSNLRPLQWKNNASKQEGRLTCPVTASGAENVEKQYPRY